LTNSSESEKEEVVESEHHPLPALDGGATSDEERVTANFNIFNASFQCVPCSKTIGNRMK